METSISSQPLARAKLPYRKHALQTLRLAWPVVLGQLGHIVISNADTIMIGRLGPTELAASSLANSLFWVSLVIGLGVSMGISPLVAQEIGAGRESETRSLLEQGFTVGFWLSLILAGVTLLLTLVVPYMGQNPEVADLAIEYMYILAASAVPVMIFLVYKHFIDGFGVVMPGMLIMIVVVIFNIGFNWLLIEGNLGFPRLELVGAGWATFISRVIGMVLVVAVLWQISRFRDFRKLPNPFKVDWGPIRKILKIGLPTGFQLLFEIGAFSGAVVLAGWIGEKEQSAHQIAISMAAITYMVYSGIAAAASIRVGNLYGARDLTEARRAGEVAMVLGIVFVLLSVLTFVLGQAAFPTYYIKDPEVIGIASTLLLIAAAFQFGDGIQAIAMGILRGMSDVNIPTVITFNAYWVVGLPMGYIFAFPLDLGVNGLWYGLTLGLSVSALFLSLRFWALIRKKRKENTLPQS